MTSSRNLRGSGVRCQLAMTLLARFLVFALLAKITLLLSSVASAGELQHTVLVYGATPGGIAAAVAAAKGGQDVLLIEPTSRIGGMLTCGLSYADFRSFESLSGFFLDFSRRVEKHYADKYGLNSPQLKDCFRGTHGEPSVNLRVLERMISEQPNITLRTQMRIESVGLSPLSLGRQRIHSVTVRDTQGKPHQVLASIYIDGSYEGDLMALAREAYHVGRESRAQYGEPQAGNELGQADGQVQGYNLRFIMTDVESNKRMPEPPAGYQRDDFTAVLAHFESKRLQRVFSDGHDGIYRAHIPYLPNGKTDVNDTPQAPIRLSMPDINDDYPDGDATKRADIIGQHYYYNVGLLYFLQNDAAVPDSIRADARRFGWCKDEFEDTQGVPPQLYIREARRMVGQHVFTGRDTEQATEDARAKWHPDSIATGDYIHNCHGTGRTGTRYAGKHVGEFYKVIQPFQVPYGVIVPQKTENLLVPVACSASHFGFSALRLEPIWCSLGQAAGWAATLSMETSKPVQSIDVPALQRRLHKDRSATIYVSDVSPSSELFEVVQALGTSGGLHGLDKGGHPLPQSLGGQYRAAFLGHAVKLHEGMDTELANRWSKLLNQDVKAIKDSSNQTLTRGQWLAP